MHMIDEEKLNEYRLGSTLIRVVRDAEPSNDVRGFVIAWDEKDVLIRKRNRKVVKLPRTYLYQPADEPRKDPEWMEPQSSES